MAYGAGLGSILRINKTFSFNPEATFHSTMERNSQVFTTLAPLFNINLFSRLALVAGPSVSWIHKGPFVKSALYKPSAGFYDYSFDKRNGLNVGAQIAVRLRVD